MKKQQRDLNNIRKLMKSGVSLLGRLEKELNLEIKPSLTIDGYYIVTTYSSRYYEDSGDYVRYNDYSFYVNSTRKMREGLKDVYGVEKY